SPMWYRLYCRYYYCVSSPSAHGLFYCVSKGLHVGVFVTWYNTSALTTGVSRSMQSKITSVEEGIVIFEDIMDIGGVEILS
ncbi:hypothetical protein BDN67DRAFT_910776, partial [Paxillus ammoniavirescens]